MKKCRSQIEKLSTLKSKIDFQTKKRDIELNQESIKHIESINDISQTNYYADNSMSSREIFDDSPEINIKDKNLPLNTNCKSINKDCIDESKIGNFFQMDKYGNYYIN